MGKKMNERKAVFFDVDGTLFKQGKDVPKSTIRAIAKIRENGHLAFVCTGRSRVMVPKTPILDIGFDGVVAACGMYADYQGRLLFAEEMRQEVLDQLLRTFSNIKSWTNLSIPKGLQFQASVFPLNDVFDSVAASCVRLEHDVDLVIYPTTLNINGDRQLTEILLRNLVNNALQHTTEGKVSVYAELLPEDNRFVHIEVQDTGTGMDEETIDNLFRADKKVNNPDPDAPHGSGFGLILCKYIIKRHDDNTLRGCRIWAESEPGQGSTFHCLLAGSGNEGWKPYPWRIKNNNN